MDDRYIAYGGRRGGGQLYHAVSTVERLRKELAEVKAERDSLVRQIARVEYTDDPLTCERVIRIRYTDLLDEATVIGAILIELQNLSGK